jgi:hypothetical protein
MTDIVNVKKKERIYKRNTSTRIKKIIYLFHIHGCKKKIAIRVIYELKNNKSTIMTKSILYLIGR